MPTDDFLSTDDFSSTDDSISLNDIIVLYKLLNGLKIYMNHFKSAYVKFLTVNKHTREYNKASAILSDLHDLSLNIHEDNILYNIYFSGKIAEATLSFLKVDESDKTVLRCCAWKKLAICYALLGQFQKSYKCLDSISSIETHIWNFSIRGIQENVPKIKEDIKRMETRWNEQQKKAEEEIIKRTDMAWRDEIIQQINQALEDQKTKWDNLQSEERTKWDNLLIEEGKRETEENKIIAQMREELEKVQKEGKKRKREVAFMVLLLIAIVALVFCNNLI